MTKCPGWSNFCRWASCSVVVTEKEKRRCARETPRWKMLAILHAPAESAPLIFKYPFVFGIKYNSEKFFFFRGIRWSIHVVYFPHCDLFFIRNKFFFRYLIKRNPTENCPRCYFIRLYVCQFSKTGYLSLCILGEASLWAIYRANNEQQQHELLVNYQRMMLLWICEPRVILVESFCNSWSIKINDQLAHELCY